MFYAKYWYLAASRYTEPDLYIENYIQASCKSFCKIQACLHFAGPFICNTAITLYCSTTYNYTMSPKSRLTPVWEATGTLCYTLIPQPDWAGYNRIKAEQTGPGARTAVNIYTLHIIFSLASRSIYFKRNVIFFMLISPWNRFFVLRVV